MRFEKISLSDTNEAVYLDAYIADPIKCLTRKAILVIPGGGYGGVCADREGEPIAMAFMPYGYNAFVLHYTVNKTDTFPIQLIEATKAIKHIKDHAEDYGIDPNEVFTVGFSAGGHLAACTGVLWKLDAVQRAVEMSYGYNKPKGTMLIYPVTTPESHFGSFKNLWATDEPSEEQLRTTNIPLHVDADSAPAFIMHTANDQTVDVKGSLELATAYSKAKIPFEVHIFPDSPHGVALGNKITECGNEKWTKSAIAEWVRMAAAWAETL
ncbi:MAG: alpha/beta hydrolase [Clostridia bacterium]|nr:alpha/beta hydrolase [Clostridia bacterium]